MVWWLWALAGIGLMFLELLIPAFFIVFFGAGAIIVGLLALGLTLGLSQQLFLFVVISIALLLMFRRRFMNKTEVDTSGSEFGPAGTSVVITELGEGNTAKGTLRGAPWNVRNLGDGPLNVGDELTIEKVDGVVLVVRKSD